MRSVSVGVVFSQRRTQLTTEPAMGCDSGPPLNRNWVGRPSTYIVCVVETRAARFTGKYRMGVGQNRRCWWNLKINVEDIYCSFSPQLYPGHLGFLPMRKTNTVIFTKDISQI